MMNIYRYINFIISVSFVLFVITSSISGKCQDEISMDNALVTVKLNTTQGVKYIFKCITGYLPTGKRTHTCLSTGDWLGPTPRKCEVARCRRPDQVPNTEDPIIQDGFKLGTTITINCLKGYKTQDKTEMICELTSTGAKWRPPNPPSCTIVKCPPLPQIPDVTYRDPKTTFELQPRILRNEMEYNSKAEVDCANCMDYTEPVIRTCLETGDWSDSDGVCKVRTCQNFNPYHATLSPDKAEYECAENVEVKCKPNGTPLKGDDHVRCRGDSRAEWSFIHPGCNAPCEARDVENGEVITAGNTKIILHGKSFEDVIKCKPKFTLSSKKAPECSNGTWNFWPKCLQGACEVPTIDNGRVDGYRAADFVENGTKLTYLCNDNYVISGNTKATCINESLIPDSLPTCTPPSCELPTNVTIPSKSDNCHDTKKLVENNCLILYKCYPEHKQTKALCKFGAWSPPIECPKPTDPPPKPLPVPYLIVVIVASVLGFIIVAVMGYFLYKKVLKTKIQKYKEKKAKKAATAERLNRDFEDYETSDVDAESGVELKSADVNTYSTVTENQNVLTLPNARPVSGSGKDGMPMTSAQKKSNRSANNANIHSDDYVASPTGLVLMPDTMNASPDVENKDLPTDTSHKTTSPKITGKTSPNEDLALETLQLNSAEDAPLLDKSHPTITKPFTDKNNITSDAYPEPSFIDSSPTTTHTNHPLTSPLV